MNAYLAALRIRDYRLLWIALILNLLGDGATFAAMAWITVTKAGAIGLGALGVCFTLPVLVGGIVIGPLLDRFPRRKLLIWDSVFRGLVVALIPLMSAVGVLAMWHLYAFAAIYGLLKIIPLAGVPAVIPELVPPERLQAAAGLEATAMGAANIAGPALGVGLIALIGAQNVLILDAVTYLVFAGLIMAIKAPLGRPEPTGTGPAARRVGWSPVIRMLVRDRFLLYLTLGFALFNISAGAIVVVLPWLAAIEYGSGPGILGLMLAAAAVAELVGSIISGAVRTSARQMLVIGVLQLAGGAALLLMVPRALPFVLAGLVLNGVLAGPMTVLGGVVRLTRIPNMLRGRAMTLMRTTMSGALPFGAALGGILLDRSQYTLLIVGVAALAAALGLLIALRFRDVDFRDETLPAVRPATTPA